MEKYIHLFNTQAEFEAAYNGSEYKEPWLSYTEENNTPAFNKPGYADYTKIPFTIEALGSGIISWSLGSKTVQYSKNCGSWETMTKNTSIHVVQGDEVQFKGTNTNYNGNKFSSTVQFNAKGNVMSLLHGDEYTNLTTITSRAFAELFRQETEIISAKNLILPSTTLESHCYYNMFNGCTNLIYPPELQATTLAESCYCGMFCGCSNLNTAPDLIALTLVESCYDSMFMNCSKINYIKAMFTTEPSWFTVNCWLDGTSSSGTFVKNSAAQWEVFGQDGIPTGWTVQTATS